MREEVIWYKDIVGFFEISRLIEFFPYNGMTLTEQLNSILRFSIYFALILIIFGKGPNTLFIPVVVALVSYMVFISTALEPLEEDMTCTEPTPNNPFMNVLQSDYVDRPQRPKACDILSEEVAHDVENLHRGTLVRDADDVFGRKSGSRQFVANPITTIPNDQASFAKWLYGTAPTCKGSRNKCLYRT
jgi:hypothetical protein